MGEEKRKALRVNTSLFVQYCFDVNSEEKRWDITSAKNLSETGVCLQTGKPFEVGATIALRFKIPSRPFDKIEINARVVCSQSIGQGTTSMIRAEFMDVSEDIKGVLREYVLWMVKNPSL
jgi:hypothetical protein